MIFLIQKMWSKHENYMFEAFGYKTVGYVTDEETAKKLVADAGTVGPDENGDWGPDSWPLEYVNHGNPVPVLRYEPVEVFQQ